MLQYVQYKYKTEKIKYVVPNAGHVLYSHLSQKIVQYAPWKLTALVQYGALKIIWNPMMLKFRQHQQTHRKNRRLLCLTGTMLL